MESPTAATMYFCCMGVVGGVEEAEAEAGAEGLAGAEADAGANAIA